MPAGSYLECTVRGREGTLLADEGRRSPMFPGLSRSVRAKSGLSVTQGLSPVRAKPRWVNCQCVRMDAELKGEMPYD
ncbi:hypothetical protein ARTHROSP310_20150 [Arthrobacter sp. AD-310]